MNKKITDAFNNVKRWTSKNSPAILTGIGITGMITSGVLAVKATPKALQIIESERLFREEGEYEPITKLDVVKLSWKYYIPSILTCGISTACIIGGQSINSKRNAALLTAYKITEESLAIYKDKVIETIGEKKEQQIKDKVAKERIEKNPVKPNDIIITGKGSTLCYDASNGRYFESDIETIKKAVNEINREMTYNMYASLNDFYDYLGLSHVSQGDYLGWNMDDGLLAIDFSSQISDDGRPCIVIDYAVAPKYDYSRLM